MTSEVEVETNNQKDNFDPEELANKARESLSTYCFTECKAKCCRKGFLLLKAEEVPLMQGVDKEKLKVIPTAEDGREFVLNLGEKETGCPNLQDYKCMIHKNPNRPKACQDFPLFIWKNKTIMVTHACPGVRENMLYPFLAEFKMKGYKIVEIEGKY